MVTGCAVRCGKNEIRNWQRKAQERHEWRKIMEEMTYVLETGAGCLNDLVWEDKTKNI